ncbi:hypothetical protein [Streptomyces tritici]|uniref:hypothetical protein n=1 Tax=Streptomyces tritici TaxID=2054410 RepID=UPI003AF1C7EB
MGKVNQQVADKHRHGLRAARRRYADDVLSFSPWHALEAHRPLGSIMRSRRAARPASSDFRHRVEALEGHRLGLGGCVNAAR